MTLRDTRAPLAQLEQLAQRGGGDAVAREVDVGRVLLFRVIQRGFQKFDGGAGTQIAASDADGDEDIGILPDTGGRGLNAGELLFIVIGGQGEQPRNRAQAGAGVQQLVSSRDLRLQGAPIHEDGQSFRDNGFPKTRT